MREFRAGMQWEEPYVDINSNSFLSENHRFDEWSRQNGDFINSLNTINELSDYYPPPSDIGMSELIQKVLVEHKIPTDELINELRTNNTLGKVIEYLNDHISIDEERLLYVNRLNKYSHNLFEMNKYDTLSYDGKTTNVNFFESFLNTTNGAIRAPELNFKYDSILSSLDSKNPENVYGFSDMKLLLKNIIWDQNKQIYNKTTIDGLKNRLEKNIELYKIIKSITALKKIESPTESQQSELTNLINQAKHILSNKENLFDSNFKYYFDKNNSLKEIERLKKETDLGQLSFENTDLNYVAKQLDENLEKRDLKESSIIDGKIKDLNDKKAKDLLDLKNQQLQLINEIDVGDVSSYKEAIENYSLTEKQINELNKKIAESMKGGVANTVVGYKNFNGGSRTHIVGAENIVLSQESGVIGNNNNLSREATNTFVLGSNVTTNIPNSVALGKDTTLSAPIATPSHTIAGTQYNFAGIAPVGTVSIGAEGKERTLTNLAAGRISNTSTDGINGSQLNAVIETLNGLSTELTTLKNAPKGGKTVIKAGEGLNLTEGEDGSLTLSNAMSFTAGNGMNVNKEGNNITITNTKPFEDIDKEKLNTASTNANNALEKANTNEGAINTANGKIAVNEGKIATNEGNITSLTNDVTTIGNTANSALNKANTNETVINNVSGVANEALGKANTAVQPDKLKAGDGISVNKLENGEITITNTRESGNGLANLTIEGKDNITVNKEGDKYVIGSKALPSTGNTLPKLAVAGDKNIDATIDDNNHVSLKLKDNLDVQNLKSKTVNADNLTAENVNTGNLNAKNVNAEKLIIGGNELGTKGLTIGNININENGIDAGNKPINNVGDGEISPNSRQAINGRQIYPIVNQLDIQRQHIQNLDDRVGRVEQGLHKQNTLRKAGNASAMATAGLLQPHKSGQSGITAAIGQYQGQTAVAVGYSALSDNGKYGVKFSLNTNTQKEMGGSAGVGYFW